MGLLVGFGLGSAGCSGGGEGGEPRLPAGQPRPEIQDPANLPPLGSLELMITSDAPLRLGFRESALIEAQLSDGDGNPVVGAAVSFGLLGRPQDASLARILAVTDDQGMASTTIMSGAKPAAFAVRVSAPGAYDQLVDVAVSNAGFGTLAVRARYYGTRETRERTVVTKASDETCDELQDERVGDAMMRLAEGQDEVQFLALPAGIEYAVLGYAYGAGSTVVAQGCLDHVRVRADSATNVVIQYRDQPISVGGELELHAELRSESVATTLLATALNASTAAVVNDASGRPAPELAEARFLLDSLDGALRSDDYKDRPGMWTLANDIAAARALRAAQHPEAAVAALLAARRGEGALYALEALGDYAAALLKRVGLDAELAIASGTPLALEVRTTRLSALGVRRGEPAVVLDLPLDAEPMAATAVLAAETDQLMLEPSQVSVAFGALGLQVLRRVTSTELPGHGVELRALIGCQALSEWLASDQVPGGSACDEGCVAATCERALARLLGAAETALLGLDAVRPTVTLSGPFDLSDEDGDLRAELLISEALSGHWSAPSSEQPTGDALRGTATAMALEPPDADTDADADAAEQ